MSNLTWVIFWVIFCFAYLYSRLTLFYGSCYQCQLKISETCSSCYTTLKNTKKYRWSHKAVNHVLTLFQIEFSYWSSLLNTHFSCVDHRPFLSLSLRIYIKIHIFPQNWTSIKAAPKKRKEKIKKTWITIQFTRLHSLFLFQFLLQLCFFIFYFFSLKKCVSVRAQSVNKSIFSFFSLNLWEIAAKSSLRSPIRRRRRW